METIEHANVVLPTAVSSEKHGMFADAERRIQRVRASMKLPGKAHQDQEITQELAARLGYDWSYDHPREIMDEISELTPVYSDVSYERLDSGGEHRLQWPYWDNDHPGIPYFCDYEGGNFNLDDGLACFVLADDSRPGELPDEEFPPTFTSRRILYH